MNEIAAPDAGLVIIPQSCQFQIFFLSLSDKIEKAARPEDGVVGFGARIASTF